MAFTPVALNEAEIAFSGGENHAASETRIPEGYARRMVNLDIDDTGVVTSRPVLGHIAGEYVHSIWQDPNTDIVMAVAEDVVCEVEGDNLVPLKTPGGDGVSAYSGRPMQYLSLEGAIYFTDGMINGVVRGDNRIHPWGVHNPVPPRRDPEAERVVYLTYEDESGQESGAVRFDTGDIPARPGLVPRLYWADDESTQYRLNGTGRVLKTQGKAAFPPGRHLTVLGGRIFVARGKWLYYSDPLAYGLADPRYGFEKLESRITALGAVDDGLYVATETAVYFYAGTDPRGWQRRTISNRGAIMGSGCVVPTDAIEQEMVPDPGTQTAFAYLTRSGVAYAGNSGIVIEPTNDTLRLPTDVEVRMDLVARHGYYQLVAVPQEPAGSASTEAIDSPVESPRGEV